MLARGRSHTARRAVRVQMQSMLSMALAFFIVAVIAGVFGFAGSGAGPLNAGQLVFYVFLALFLLSFVAELRRKS
jgi:uncharacterized membrane protein YtjA (UPF0391 family)